MSQKGKGNGNGSKIKMIDDKHIVGIEKGDIIKIFPESVKEGRDCIKPYNHDNPYGGGFVRESEIRKIPEYFFSEGKALIFNNSGLLISHVVRKGKIISVDISYRNAKLLFPDIPNSKEGREKEFKNIDPQKLFCVSINPKDKSVDFSISDCEVDIEKYVLEFLEQGYEVTIRDESAVVIYSEGGVQTTPAGAPFKWQAAYKGGYIGNTSFNKADLSPGEYFFSRHEIKCGECEDRLSDFEGIANCRCGLQTKLWELTLKNIKEMIKEKIL